MKHSLLIKAYNEVRQYSLASCETLGQEDFNLQGAAFASPPKWHLAHTTWFFETFILKVFVESYKVFNKHYEVLFNSYYNSVGEQYPRPKRGLLTRPYLKEILEYREYVDNAIHAFFQQDGFELWPESAERCRLGIEHEKQHQELFYTDIKYSLFQNPLRPALFNRDKVDSNNAQRSSNSRWLECKGGLVSIGANAKSIDAFMYDNEGPEHTVYLEDYTISDRLVTNGEYMEFIRDGGYQQAALWLSDGWTQVQQQAWCKPLYWIGEKNHFTEFTLYGEQDIDLNAPVSHVSAFEADAYANWANARLPTEQEWEHVVKLTHKEGAPFNAPFNPYLHPQACNDQFELNQLYDNCWQWTSSAYRPYPGFEPGDGALGEYNGKFMCNQWVLRGGSCVSSQDHLRASYRNFFYPEDRWQFSGIRLAKKL